MRILFIGDVMGRSGRDAVTAHLSDVKTKVKADVVILNGENAASGIGITEKIVKQFYKDGVDVITTGNHVWDQREIIPYIDRDPKLLRPINFPDGTPGKGSYIHGRILEFDAVLRRSLMKIGRPVVEPVLEKFDAALHFLLA